jgi:hypothetical protein
MLYDCLIALTNFLYLKVSKIEKFYFSDLSTFPSGNQPHHESVFADCDSIKISYVLLVPFSINHENTMKCIFTAKFKQKNASIKIDAQNMKN